MTQAPEEYSSILLPTDTATGLTALDETPRKRLARILDDPQAIERVQKMPGQDLYLLIHDLGLADGYDLVPMASPEQFQTFIDFDGMAIVGDGTPEIREDDVGAWLSALFLDMDDEMAADGTNAERFDKIAALDTELLQLWVAEAYDVIALFEDEDPIVDTDRPLVKTPDGQYLLVAKKADGFSPLIAQMLDLCWRQDPALARLLVEGARHDTRTVLTEDAWHFREARMEDLGFFTFDEARVAFARVDRHAPWPTLDRLAERAVGAAPREVASLTLRSRLQASGSDFFARALAQLVDLVPQATLAPLLDQLSMEAAAVVNRLVTAQGGEPSNTQALPGSLALFRAGVSLALEERTREQLGGGDETGRARSAAELVLHTPLLHLFRVGHSLALERRARYRAVASRLATAGGRMLLADGAAESMRALMAVPPKFVAPPETDSVQTAAARVGEPVPFGTMRQLEIIDTLLGEVAFLATDFFALTGLSNHDAALPPTGDYGVIFNTLLAHRAIASERTFGPLSADELRLFLHLGFEKNPLVEGATGRAAYVRRPTPFLLRQAHDILCGKVADDPAKLAAAQRVTARFVGQLLDEVGQLALDLPIAPTFVGGLWLLPG